MQDHISNNEKNDVLKRQDQSNHDLQNEIAQRDEVPRQKRFLVNGDPENIKDQKQKNKEHFVISALEMLLRDPEYAALYYETKDMIIRLMSMTEKAIENEKQQLNDLEENHIRLLVNSNKLSDGRLVFKNQQGQVITENKEHITDPVLLESIVWQDNAPSYEDYISSRDKIEKSQNKIDALTDYQINVLGTSKDRLENEDDPPSKEELQQIKENILNNAPEAIKEQLEQESTAHTVDTNPDQIAAFKM